MKPERTHPGELDFMTLEQKDTGHASQVLDVYFPKPLELPPDKKLLLAVIEDAIKCLEEYSQATSRTKKELFRLAVDWINNPDDDYVFSFIRVCDELGLNPQATRRALHERLAGAKSPKASAKNFVVEDSLDEGFTHAFIGQTHCEECKVRYIRAWQKNAYPQKGKLPRGRPRLKAKKVA